jgi:hypothetical protein
MKLLRLLTPCLVFTSAVIAQSSFPGLKSILSEAEWKRAGLDKLSPDQIGVIDAALIRHQAGGTRAVVATAPAAANGAAPVAPTVVVPPEPPPGATPAEAAAARSRFWDKFGLGKFTSGDWRSQPPMKAKVTGWQGANRFVIDTGQVWEGVEQIPYEILGQEITIMARAAGAFAMKLNETSVEVLVRRVK